MRTVAAIFAARDRAGELARWFAGDPSLTAEQRRIVETEEAWTLGVTAPRRSPSQSASVPCRRKMTGGSHGQSVGGEAVPPRETLPPGSHCRRAAASGPQFERSRLRPTCAIRRRSTAARSRWSARRRISARFPAALRPLALRLAHAAGDVAILDDLAWSRGAVAAATPRAGRRRADPRRQRDGRGRHHARPAAGRQPGHLHAARSRSRRRWPRASRTTRSAAAVELWRPHLAGAVVAIGNAPTALFHLLEMLAAGAARPALVLGFPVGFVGAAEAKEALIGFGGGLAYVALRGRRGGSALAAAAVNALCAAPERAA